MQEMRIILSALAVAAFLLAAIFWWKFRREEKKEEKTGRPMDEGSFLALILGGIVCLLFGLVAGGFAIWAWLS
ncbi:MAG: hypothetical protein HOO67_07945 [Candidatus Peribacteraceae bacterium]|nr:hypothetical protein [Candidatus Peribacteraceae bacterium]